MAGRNCADIVFCIDTSGSMQPCRDAVAANLEQLLEGLKSDTQSYWDVRFDYLAFHNSNQSDGGLIHHCSSVRLPSCPLVDAIYKNQGNSQEYSQFFTKDVNEFKKALMKEPLEGEEMQLLGLDIALDFPWRASSDCHRVVVLLTDEPVETGIRIEEQVAKMSALINKIMKKRVKLFIIAPESKAFYELSMVDRCEYTDLSETADGLSTVDFSKMLQTIGRSVSVSQSYDGGINIPMPTYGQEGWGTRSGEFGSDN